MPLKIGTVLNDRYRIIQPMAQCGYGAIYKAWDRNLDEPCTIKENRDSTPEAAQRFKTEAAVLYKLKHPNLARISDFFFIPDQGQYLVMEYVEGESLAEKLANNKQPISLQVASPWVDQVLDALEYLHGQTPPIVHNEISPNNIRIAPDGRAVLVNFGISRVYDPFLKTTTGSASVILGYSPSEQYGMGITDARSDIYSLGATLYTLLTGAVLPPSVDIATGAIPKPLPVHQLNRTLSPAISALVEKAVHSNQQDRYSNIAQLRAAFSQATKSSSNASQSKGDNFLIFIKEVIQDFRKRWPILGATGTLTILLACIFIVSLIGFMGYLRHGRSSDRLAILPTATSTPNPQPIDTGTPVAVLVTTTQVIPSATPGSGATRVSEIDGMTMVYVSGGEFLIGQPAGSSYSFPQEQPQKRIFLDSFWIDQTEVTNGMYELCVQGGVCRVPFKTRSFSRTEYYGSPVYADYPVIFVTWDDADSYCRWAGRRLPTEAEWEKAARGSEGGMYPWGQKPADCKKANFWEYEIRKNRNTGKQVLRKGCESDTMKVGNYPDGASIYGALDMVGNVKEWAADWYDEKYYQFISGENPSGPENGEHRVIRDPFGYQVTRPDSSGRPDNIAGVRKGGGGFGGEHGFVTLSIVVTNSGSSVANRPSAFSGGGNINSGFEFIFVLRVTYRYGAPANLADYNLGFRCAVSP